MVNKILTVSDDGILEQRIDRSRHNIPLIGIKNGANQIFTTPEKFTQTTNDPIRIYRNGQRLCVSTDYSVAETGGPDTGFDQITLMGPAPIADETLVADYLAFTL